MIERDLRTVLQPIVHAVTGEVWGHEVLLRGPRGSEWESPTALFHEADQHNQRASLELQARQLGVSRLPHLPTNQWLFINIDPWVKAADPPIPAPPDRVILEISETRPILENPEALAQIARWREQGHYIAIDDYGAGYMGLSALLTLKPDIIKIDRYIIEKVDQDPVRRACIEALLHVSKKSGAQVIAEGVETPEEYWVLRHCGVRYMQGYLFGRPQEHPVKDRIRLPKKLGRIHVLTAVKP